MGILLSKKKRMVLGGFYGDAIALGAHWIYDVKQIQEQFGTIRSLTTPLATTYHTGKKKGDFTHYGDQALVLLESIQEKQEFRLQDYKQKWSEFFDSYTGYFDGATKKTLANIAADKADPVGSLSKDLAGASRIAPLMYRYGDLSSLLNAVREHVSMTHNNESTINTALFFARMIHLVLDGETVGDSITASLDMLEDDHLQHLIEQGTQASNQESVTALQIFGTACAIEQSLPGVIQIVSKYSGDFQGAMTANVMAGGDSAARGALIGMIVAAASPVDEALFVEMNEYEKIKVML